MWHLLDKEGAMLGEFDWVISTTPPAQTLRLFNRHIIQSHPLRTARMQGCYALMLGFNKPWDRQWIAAKVNNNPIHWISVNSSKPGRDSKVTCLVVHSRNDWAEAHMDQNMSVTEKLLIEQFVRLTGYPADNADYVALHRWRYATVDNARKIGSYIDKQLRLGATGDWCESSRIEEAWVHATKLADQIV